MARKQEYVSHGDVQEYRHNPVVHNMAHAFAQGLVRGHYTLDGIERALRCGRKIAERLKAEKREREINWGEFHTRTDL
jgi:hypothetical protein